MTDVFISYKKEDVDRVRLIAEALAEAGYEVWWDHRIPPGRTYREVIGAALQTAKCVIVVWSEKSVESQWVLDEADAGQQRRVLLPILIDNVMPPYGFGQIEAARLIQWSGDTNELEWKHTVEAVAHLVGREPGAAPPVSISMPSGGGRMGESPAVTLATPGAALNNRDKAQASGGKTGGMAGLLIGALLLIALLGGGAYYAIANNLFSGSLPPDEGGPTITVENPDMVPEIKAPLVATVRTYISDESQRRQAEQVVNILRAAGHTVSGAQNVGANAPRDMGVVRYFNEESEPYAEAVIKAIQAEGGLPDFDDRINRNFPDMAVGEVELYFPYVPEPEPEPEPQSGFPGINGANVMSVTWTSTGRFEYLRDGFWIIPLENGLPARTYRELGRDEWSVYLQDVQSNEELALDTYLRQVKRRQGTDFVKIGDLSAASKLPGSAPRIADAQAFVFGDGLRFERLSAGPPETWVEVDMASGQRSYIWTKVHEDQHFMELTDDGRGARMRVDLIQKQVYLYFPDWGQFNPQWPITDMQYR